MLIVPRKRIWTQQPQGAAYPSQLVGSAVACASVVGCDSIAKTTLSGTPTKVVMPSGLGYTYSSGQYHNVSHGFTGNSYSIIAIARISHEGTVRQIIDDDDGAHRAFQLRANDYAIWFIPFDSTGSPIGISLPTMPIGLSGAPKICAVIARSGGGKVALDVSLLGGTSGTLPSHKALSGSVYIGNSKANTTVPNIDGVLAYVIVPWYLSNSDVGEIIDNPWQIFRAPDSRIFVPTGSGAPAGDSLTVSSIIASPATVGSPQLSQKHALSASSIITAPAVVTSPAIIQRHSLSAASVSASPAVVGSPSITQKHVLSATAITAASAVVGSPTLTEIVAGILSALPIVAAPAVVGAPAITQKHALSAGAISAGPATFGTPTLAQQHALIAQGITASAAAVGRPLLSEGGAVAFTRAPTGGGYSRSAENYTRPPQTNTARP